MPGMNTSTARWLVGVLLLSSVGCSKPTTPDAPAKEKEKSSKSDDDKSKSKSDGDDDDDTPKKKTKPAKAASDDDDDDGKKAEPAKAALPDKKAVGASLTSFFASYADKSDFAFYDTYFAPSVDKFISMKSTTPAAMAKESRAFYGGKTDLKYTPQLATLVVTPDPSGDTEKATIDVRMEWKYPPPKAWATMEGQSVVHSHLATVEIVVGSDGKWTSYGEPGLKRDSYKVVAEDGSLAAWTTPGEVDDDDAKAPVHLAKGTVVQDGFETLVVEMNTKGEVVARRIHQAGKDWWALDHGAVAVENPNGGTSAGEETYLEKVK